MRGPFIKFTDVRFVRSTASAVLVRVDGGEHWIPDSHIHDDSEINRDGNYKRGTLVVTKWIAEQKNIVDAGEEYEP